jgi:hypothetical protein
LDGASQFSAAQIENVYGIAGIEFAAQNGLFMNIRGQAQL